MIYARFSHPDYGYYSDVENAKKLEVFGLYKVVSVSVGQSYTSICLEGTSGYFNSVQFDFFDEKGNVIDVYTMPEFNPYLRSKEIVNASI